jgi:hypothetical protein
VSLRSPSELDLGSQRKLLLRLAAESRRWFLRAILFGVMAVVSFQRGGSFFLTLGIAFVALAGLGLALSRQNRRAAARLAENIALLDAASKPPAPHAPPSP